MKNRAREATKIYHQKLYTNNRLFSKNASWLEKPEQTIIDIVKNNFRGKKNIKVLDLGAGVGRNAIPIAKIIEKSGGKIICVDYLDVAIDQLNQYAKKYGVMEFIDGIVSPIEDFAIKPNTYDLIIAHSVLTHVESKEKMVKTIKMMINGTKNNGVNYIHDITNLKEFDAETGNPLKPDAEIVITSQELKLLLKERYCDWKVLSTKITPYEERFEKNNQEVIWCTDYVTFVTKRSN